MRSRTTFPARLIALGLAAALTACVSAMPGSSQPEPQAAQATSVPVATATPAATSTETPVPATPTPTAIVLSATDRDDVLIAFRTMAGAELAARVMLRGATMALDEADANPFQAGTRMLAGAMVTGLMRQQIDKTTPPLTLKPFWDEMLAGSDEQMDMLKLWTNQEMKVSEIEAKMPPIIDRISAAVDNAQTTLILLYGWDSDELEAARNDMLDREDSFFTTATPTP